MRVTYNWLKDFVEIKIPPQALADKLTMAGLEVTALKEKDKDFVFEIEVTSNRPDLLSVIGIAREVAAITRSKLKAHSVERIGHSKAQLSAIRYPLSAKTLKIDIESKKDCPLYTAKIIKGVKVGPSPQWLKKRLELVGCRSINNIVDITNYILFEYGEPLHAFDLDKLARQKTGDRRQKYEIIIRRAKKDEKIITIDAEEKTLNPDILVISDKDNPIAIAGIMGGKDTEVTESTKNILLEAAIFNPIIVRRSRQQLGLQSDSSYRFERGIDAQIVEEASWAAVKLIEGSGSFTHDPSSRAKRGISRDPSAKCVLAKHSGQARRITKNINLDLPSLNKILGIEIPANKIQKILTSLGFKLKARGKNNFMVKVPSHRSDINLAIDLVEEIARMFGYESIPTTLPAVKANVSMEKSRDTISLIKNILTGLGLNEVITYSLTDKDELKGFAQQKGAKLIEIENPLSKEQEVLRPSLLPGLANCVAYNLRQKQAYINIFEIAKIYFKSQGKIKEQNVLGITLCGARPVWTSAGRIQDEAGLLHLKGILETLLQRFCIEPRFVKKDDTLVEVYIKNIKIGILKVLPQEIINKLEIKNKDVFQAELVLDKLLPHAKLNKVFVPLPRFPAISRDISLVLKEGLPVDEVIHAVKQRAGNLLQQVEVTNYYKGKQIPEGYKNLTIACRYYSLERTLTEEEINPVHAGIIEGLKEQLNATIR